MLLRRVKANNLGLSAVSRLIQAGMSRHALVLLGAEYGRLKQALSVELGILDGVDLKQN